MNTWFLESEPSTCYGDVWTVAEYDINFVDVEFHFPLGRKLL